MNKKILYITYNGLCDPLGRSQILPYLTHCADTNQIDIISFEKQKVFDENKEHIKSLIPQQITWHPISFSTKIPFISKLWDIFKFRKKIRKILKTKSIQIVHARSYIPAFAVLSFLKKNSALKFIFDIRGFWIDERIDEQRWKINNFITILAIRFLRKLEIKAYQRANIVIALSEKAIPIIEKKMQVARKDIILIPCAVDTKLFNPEIVDQNKVEQLRKELNLPQPENVLLYSGSLGGLYLTDELFLFYSKYKEVNKNSKLLLLTNTKKETIQNQMNKFGIESTDLVFQFVSREEMPLYLSLSKIAIQFIKPSFSKIASSPTKLAEYMSMGLFVISNTEIGDINNILSNPKHGILIDNFENESIENVINKIQETKNQWDKTSIRNYALEHFSLREHAATYKKIYQDL